MLAGQSVLLASFCFLGHLKGAGHSRIAALSWYKLLGFVQVFMLQATVAA